MASPRFISTSHGTNREAFTALDWGLFLSVSAIWGSSFLFMAIGLDAFHPGLVTLIRVAAGAVVVSAIPGVWSTHFDRVDSARIVVLALIWIAGPLTMFPIAQQWIDSAVAGMLNGTTPIFTMLLAALLLRSIPSRPQIVGVLVGLAGMVAIAIPSARGRTTAAIGVAMVVAATLSYATSLNMTTLLQQKHGAAPLMARVLAIGAVMVTPFGVYGWSRSSFAWNSLAAVLAAGVLGTGLAFIFIGRLAGRVGATRASFVNYLIPVVALILGVVFRDEPVGALAIAGVGAVITGAYLASRRETTAPDGGSSQRT